MSDEGAGGLMRYCTHCGHEISSLAETCPRCGHPNQARQEVGAPAGPVASPGPPSFWRAVGVTVETCVRRWRLCLLLSAPYALLASLPSQTLSAIGPGFDTGRATVDEVLVIGALFVAVAGTLILVGVLVYPPTLAALSLVGDAALVDEPIEVGALVRATLDRAFAAVGALILVFAAVAVVPVGFMMLALVIGVAVAAEVGLVVLAIGMLLSIVPGLVLGVRLWLAVPAVVCEGLGPVDALRRSWVLTRGAFWWVGGVGVLLLILAGTIAFPPQAIGAVLGAEGVVRFVVGSLFAAIAAAIQVSFTGVGTGVVYTSRVLATTGVGEAVATAEPETGA